MKARIGRLLALVAVGVLVYALNRSGTFEAAIAAIGALGAWAKPAFVALHVLSVVAFVPSVLPTFAAGVVFGFAWGLPLTLLGAGLGAALAFWLGRTAARGWVERRFAHDPRFQALSRLARERGWKIVAMARLTPIFPFSIGNYAFGVTSISARHYFLATLLGTIPSNAVYVYLGDVTGKMAEATVSGRTRTPMEWALMIGGVVVAVVLAVYLRRVASEALAQERSGSARGNAAEAAVEPPVPVGATPRAPGLTDRAGSPGSRDPA
jgi:uncharacterized membrane protein YdjX (TVP38/TMEM64 family)